MKRRARPLCAHLGGKFLCAEVAIWKLFAAKINATFCPLAAVNVTGAFKKRANKDNIRVVRYGFFQHKLVLELATLMGHAAWSLLEGTE
jgi:hypothetical protein